MSLLPLQTQITHPEYGTGVIVEYSTAEGMYGAARFPYIVEFDNPAMAEYNDAYGADEITLL